MRGPCEICMEHEVIRPMRERRDVETVMGLMKVDCCGPHSSALTVSLARRERERKAVPKHFRIHEEQGKTYALEVH